MKKALKSFAKFIFWTAQICIDIWAVKHILDEYCDCDCNCKCKCNCDCDCDED